MFKMYCKIIFIVIQVNVWENYEINKKNVSSSNTVSWCFYKIQWQPVNSEIIVVFFPSFKVEMLEGLTIVQLLYFKKIALNTLRSLSDLKIKIYKIVLR